jgi:hypothetical protein
MGIQKATLGKVHPTGCDVRVSTGDTVGGTMLSQCAPYAAACGAPMNVRIGSNVADFPWMARQLRAGRGMVVQGNSSAMIGTKWRCTGTGVNHAVYVNEVRGGTLDEPKEALVYDPAADGRKAGWGTADQGPSWWPWSLVKKFARALKPDGDTSSRTLASMGVNAAYCGVFGDTEPHFHSKFNGAKTTPFPDRVRVNAATVYSHNWPGYGKDRRVRTLHDGDLFRAFQKVTKSGVVWLGNHDGTEWLPEKKLRQVGGAT